MLNLINNKYDHIILKSDSCQFNPADYYFEYFIVVGIV